MKALVVSFDNLSANSGGSLKLLRALSRSIVIPAVNVSSLADGLFFTVLLIEDKTVLSINCGIFNKSFTLSESDPKKAPA